MKLFAITLVTAVFSTAVYAENMDNPFLEDQKPVIAQNTTTEVPPHITGKGATGQAQGAYMDMNGHWHMGSPSTPPPAPGGSVAPTAAPPPGPTSPSMTTPPPENSQPAQAIVPGSAVPSSAPPATSKPVPAIVPGSTVPSPTSMGSKPADITTPPPPAAK